MTSLVNRDVISGVKEREGKRKRVMLWAHGWMVVSRQMKDTWI